jgi:hypothetical protein
MNMNFQAILFTVALFATEANSAIHEYADYWMKAGKKQLLDILKHQQEYQKAVEVEVVTTDGSVGQSVLE